MEDADAVPTPFYEKGDREENENEGSMEEKTEFNQKVDGNYLLACSQKGKKIIFRLQKSGGVIPENYEIICDSKYMINLSKLFTICPDISDIYQALIIDLKNYSEQIKVELDNEKAIITFILDYKIYNKKETKSIYLYKKKDSFNPELLNNAFIKFESQEKILEEKLEKKVSEINLISEKQIKLQEEFEQKMKEIEEIKKAQKEYLNYIKENKTKILEMEKSNKDLKNELEKMKHEMKENKINEKINIGINREIAGLKNLFENQKNNYYNSLSMQNKNIQNLSEKSLELKTSLETSKKDFKKIKEQQEQISEENMNTNKKIKEIELNSSNNYNKLLEENENMKKLIKGLENNYSSLEKKISEMSEESIIPKDFEFNKTISTELFKKNFYNNRVCIFASHDDDKVYIVFGENPSNLVGYDINGDEKFTIYEGLHEDFFDSCRHFYDKENERDLIVTASLDSHVKVINFNREESEEIMDLNFEAKEKPIINTACFLNGIILVPFSSRNKGTIKFYNMKEEYISELEQNVGFILGLSIYYEEKKQINYILIANCEGILSYNMEMSSINAFIPKMTKEEKEKCCFGEAYVIRKGKKLLLLAPCFSFPTLFIWDFIEGNLIEKFAISSGISDICLWNNKYIFATFVKSTKENFALIEINKKEIVKSFKRDINFGCAGIKVLKHSSGNYLITANMKGNLDLFLME